MSSRPLVSIVVVCYNHARFFATCIESVAGQTYADVETFVLDNGSRDDSHGVITGSPHRQRFTYVRNAQMSLVRSLNAIHDRLSGEYVSIVAADDWWVANKIADQVAFMEANPRCGVCTGLAATVNAAGEVIAVPAITSDAPVFYSFEELLLGNFALRACVAMHRKSALDNAGWYDEAYQDEDYYMYLRMSAQGWATALIPAIQGYYRLHGNNISANPAFVAEHVRKILLQYENHPAFPYAIRRFDARSFQALAAVDRRAAFAMLPSLKISSATVRPIVVGVTKLLLPKRLFALLRSLRRRNPASG